MSDSFDSSKTNKKKHRPYNTDISRVCTVCKTDKPRVEFHKQNASCNTCKHAKEKACNGKECNGKVIPIGEFGRYDFPNCIKCSRGSTRVCKK